MLLNMADIITDFFTQNIGITL